MSYDLEAIQGLYAYHNNRYIRPHTSQQFAKVFFKDTTLVYHVHTNDCTSLTFIHNNQTIFSYSIKGHTILYHDNIINKLKEYGWKDENINILNDHIYNRFIMLPF